MSSNFKQFSKLIAAFLIISITVLLVVLISKNDTSDQTSSQSQSSSFVTSDDLSFDDQLSSSADNSSTSKDESSSSSSSSQPDIEFPSDIVDEKIKANFVALFDINAEKFIYSRNLHKKCYPASITKLLTALTACDYLKKNDVITVGNEIDLVGEGSSLSFLKKGYKLTFDQLMDAMLLASGNDSAYVMAVAAGRVASGKLDSDVKSAFACFISLMNKKAVEIGCAETNFTNPDGYHDWNHYTSVYDLAIISKCALNVSLISESAAKKISNCKLVSGEQVSWKSTNEFLNDYKYATGLKTGTTNEAGFCLSASADYQGRKLVVIIIGAEDNDKRFSYASQILNFAYGITP
ncbi:MAG: hypothetical protein RRY76_04935 [Clostridia bacterium]